MTERLYFLLLLHLSKNKIIKINKQVENNLESACLFIIKLRSDSKLKLKKLCVYFIFRSK